MDNKHNLNQTLYYMKKVFVLSLVFCAFSTLAFSQVNAHTFGVRLGGGSYVGSELSYQKGISNANRIEFDFGYSVYNNDHDRIYALGIYHWDWNITDALNWYVGPGVGAGLFIGANQSSFNVTIGGQIGLEYDFLKEADVPILASVDVRPMWDFLGDNAGFGWGAALGIRYIW
jgi:hypothetical protein